MRSIYGAEMTLSKKEVVKKFALLPKTEQWRFFIDGYRHNEGRLAFDVREKGYMKAMEAAFTRMLATVEKPLSSQIIIDLHRHALTGVENTDNVHLDTFRDGNPGDFGLVSNEDTLKPLLGNASLLGVTEFMNSGVLDEMIVNSRGLTVPRFEIMVNGKDILRSGTPAEVHEAIKGGGARLYVARESESVIHARVDKTLKTYHTEMQNAVTSDSKLNAIIKMVSTLERDHIFTDGNARTLVMLVLNRELVKNGFTPVILENPNRFDLFSIAELKNEVSAGMQMFWKHANKAAVDDILSKAPPRVRTTKLPKEDELLKVDKLLSSSSKEDVPLLDGKVESGEQTIIRFTAIKTEFRTVIQPPDVEKRSEDDSTNTNTI